MMLPAISTKAVLFGMLASTSLCIGLIGAILPGLPSTEFILLAVWAAAKSSPVLHAWLMDRRFIASLVTHYQYGTMPRRAKVAAAVTMLVSGVLMVVYIHHIPSVLCSLSIMLGVLMWLWRKPE